MGSQSALNGIQTFGEYINPVSWGLRYHDTDAQYKKTVQEKSSPKAVEMAADIKRSILLSVGKRPALLIAAAGLMLRMVYILQVVDTPIFPTMATDSAYFDAMARNLIHGHWGHPDFIFLNPFYAVFLACIYALSPSGPALAVLVQALLEGASIVLISYIGKSTSSPRAGLLAAGLYAFYGMAVFYTGLLLAPILAIFLSLATMALLLRHRETGQCNLLPWAGLIFGLLILTRTNTVLFTPLLLSWPILTSLPRLQWRSALMGVLLLALGMGLPLVLNSVRTLHFHGALDPFSAQGGINFYIGNNPDAEGIIMSPHGIPTLPVSQVQSAIELARERTGRPLDAFEASDYWLGQGLNYLVTQPRDALALYLNKLVLFWRKEEITLNINYELSRELVPVLKWFPLLSFGMVAPMALGGFLPALRGLRKSFLVPAYTLAFMASVLLFFVSDRYRLPVVPCLCILAGMTIDGLLAQWQQRRHRRLLLTLAALYMMAFGINFDFERFAGEDPGSQSIHYSNLGLGYKAKGNLAAARQALVKATSLDPNNGVAYNNLGTVLLELGEKQAAQAAFEKAIGLASSSCEALFNLARAHQESDHGDQARRLYEKATACGPVAAKAHISLARISLQSGDLKSAELHIAQALIAAPLLVDAHLTLGALETKKGNFGKALGHIQEAIELDTRNASSYVQLGLAHLQLNDLDAGKKAFSRALALDPTHTEARVSLAMALLQKNQIDAALDHLEKAHQEEPEAPLTMGLLAQAYLLKGDTAAARAMFHDLKQSDPALAARMESAFGAWGDLNGPKGE